MTSNPGASPNPTDGETPADDALLAAASRMPSATQPWMTPTPVAAPTPPPTVSSAPAAPPPATATTNEVQNAASLAAAQSAARGGRGNTPNESELTDASLILAGAALQNASNAAPNSAPPQTELPTLKQFMGENSALLSQISVLTGLSGFMVNLDLGWLDTYLKAVVLGASALLWIEFLEQWPRELVILHRLRRRQMLTRPDHTSWRLFGFAYLMQVIIVLFFTWAVTRSPEIVIPALAMGSAVVIGRKIERSGGHWLFLLALAIVAFVASELLLEMIFPDKTTIFDQLLIDAERVMRR